MKVFLFGNLWHENNPLNLYRPRLYALTTEKRSSIIKMWNATYANWNLFPRRPPRDFEIQQWSELTASFPTPLQNRGQDFDGEADV